ncbi:hypothetical protein GH714_013083 [Hevea brasiliensis]|uniref:Trichome birefringence-like C-terminal domain-containing protein n=1 Tax=Hevea brasiliensis TaxID=3981 RepID=A0A6A6MJ10_HEVBR|nr:hypothetical protein GH714_013083 [Hevea brasiliensis]
MLLIEEFKIAEMEGKKRGLKFRLLDTTQAMLLRPDGHPSRYGHWPHENVTLHNDCVHWCLPGPIDTWSDFLLEMLKMEGGGHDESSYQELHSILGACKREVNGICWGLSGKKPNAVIALPLSHSGGLSFRCFLYIRFKIERWFYVNYNFTLASFWSPHLVKAIDTDTNGPTYNRLMNLYLDEANDVWAAQIEAFDYVIISAGRWFYGPQVFFENGKVVGCHLCLKNNIKNLTMTLSPAHFENGNGTEEGIVSGQGQFQEEMKLEGDDLELYLTQVEELRRAEREGKKRGLKFRLLDINEAMVVRPDGHPNHYGHWPHENVTISDCVHWCLPGPIDTWNDFLLQMLKMEGIEKPFDFKDTASPIFVAKFFFLIKS